jgi:hypothetical protein
VEYGQNIFIRSPSEVSLAEEVLFPNFGNPFHARNLAQEINELTTLLLWHFPGSAALERRMMLVPFDFALINPRKD